mgnify:FL=1
MANDTVEIEQNVTIEIIDFPTNGMIEIMPDNRIIYLPFANFIEDKLEDRFSYTINGSDNESDVFMLLSDCPACVWPGDTDQDGQVNVWDLIPIGLAYSATGTPRSSQNTNWNGYPTTTDWGMELYGSDYKYIDCNGDGTINEEDVTVIDQNYEATHDFATPPTLPTASSAEFSIWLEVENEGPISLGDTVSFDTVSYTHLRAHETR